MTTQAQVQPPRRASYVPPFQRPPVVAGPVRRSAAVVISDLLRPRVAPTRSREEQAFVDLQRGGPS